MRNISYTPLFSKVLEQFLVEKVRSTTGLSNCQFGGVKGVSTDHFLVETWHEILTNLEERDAATSLVSTDFSKAFNRMDHRACISALREAGAEEQTINVVQAFLYDKKMAIHVGNEVSDVRQVPGGAPQGSVLGSHLFCAAPDRLSNVRTMNNTPNFAENGENSHSHDGAADAHDMLYSPPSPIAPPDHDIPFWLAIEENSDSGSEDGIDLGIRRPRQRLLGTTVKSQRADQTMLAQYLDESIDFTPSSPSVKAYIDDYNVVEKVCTKAAISHHTTGKTTFQVHAGQSEHAFDYVKTTSREIGMIVNDKKTQLLCIHPKGDAIRIYMDVDDGSRIINSDTLKNTGFHLLKHS